MRPIPLRVSDLRAPTHRDTVAAACPTRRHVQPPAAGAVFVTPGELCARARVPPAVADRARPASRHKADRFDPLRAARRTRSPGRTGPPPNRFTASSRPAGLSAGPSLDAPAVTGDRRRGGTRWVWRRETLSRTGSADVAVGWRGGSLEGRREGVSDRRLSVAR